MKKLFGQRHRDIAATSYGRAVQQAVYCAENGMTPLEVIEGVGLEWSEREPTWDDAVYSLAYAWRRTCSVDPASAFSDMGTRNVVLPAKELEAALTCERQTKRKPARKTTTISKPKSVKINQQKVRKCLNTSCGKEFLSKHYGERKCPDCRYTQRSTGELFDPRYESATA